jgi:CRISPR-associated endonuclease/helicase Cas3
MSSETFKTTFKLLTDHEPFPWQIQLFEEWFANGKFPQSCNLPTGLGKTSVIAIWLIALMDHPDKMPRRLVYVVNRRTVVDQTTDEVEKLRENLMKLENRPEHVRQLAISTLRGQFADNHEWSADPSLPAVICGTVDIIGSRLLFSGYGIGFKTKPLHAGFLGQDVLLVHDEAHLEPAFQALVVAVEKEQERERERANHMPWPNLRVMELTATSRGDEGDGQKKESFGLTDVEKKPPDVNPDPPTKPIHHVWRRQKAKKAVHLHENENEEKLADEIAGLALKHKASGDTVLVFVQKVEDVEKIIKKLPKESTLQLTGTLRGLQRDGLVNDPIFQRFLPESNRNKDVTSTPGTVYLVCTSAGEVGVNISADHMVCDLSTLESMTQRFGRVNRFANRDDTRIDIVYTKEFGKKDKKGKIKVDELDQRRQKTLELLKQLNGDASPTALDKLDAAKRLAAFAPPPTILPTTDILFDVWALTTIRGKLPGRPPVEPYLHGISEWQPPETYVAWRTEVGLITGPLLDRYSPEELLEDYPLKPHELLRDRSDRVFEHLHELAAEYPDAPAWIIEMRGGVDITTLKVLSDGAKSALNYMTVLLPPLVGGLTSIGTLDGAAVRKKQTQSESDAVNQGVNADRDIVYDVADMWEDDKGLLRKRVWREEGEPEGMIFEREIRFENPDDEDAEPTNIWRWFVRKPEAANEFSQIAYPLQPHLNEVQEYARHIVGRLLLSNELADAVVLAAACHDLGKNRERWQRSIGNYDPKEAYAKSGSLPGGKKLRPQEFLKNYRHEFGSLLDIQDKAHPRYADFKKLNDDTRELVLHLIAAHHGRARPHFPEEEAFDPEGSDQLAKNLSIEIPRRFARLQRKYGRWGLAYLESLVRAADYAASANPGKILETNATAEDRS